MIGRKWLRASAGLCERTVIDFTATSPILDWRDLAKGVLVRRGPGGEQLV